MKLRVHVKEVQNSGAPDYIFCGQGTTNLNMVNTQLLLRVDGVDIVNTGNFSTFAGSGVIDANGIDVEVAGYNGSSVIEVNIDLAEVSDSIPVYIQIVRGGFYSFKNDFLVYGYDLGDDHLGTYEDNIPFEIHMVASLVGGTIVNSPYAHHIFIREPFTNNFFYYKATSGAAYSGVIREDEEIPLETNSPNGMYTVSADSGETFVCYAENLDGEFCTSSMTLYATAICPPFVLVGTCPTAPDGCEYLINENCRFIPTTNLGDVRTIRIDDSDPTFEFSRILYEYELFNESDESQATFSISYTGVEPTDTYDATIYQWSYTPTINGLNYVILTITLVDITTNAYTCTYRLLVPICDKIDIRKIECGVYRIYNTQAITTKIIIYSLDEKGNLTELVSQTGIDSEDYYEFAPDADGVYIIEIPGETPQYFSLVNDCQMQTCLLSSIENLNQGCFCKSDCNCGCSNGINDKRFQFTSLMGMFMTYQAIFNDDNVLSGLDQNISDDNLNYLVDIQKLLNNISKLKDNCNPDSLCSGDSPCNC